MADKRYNPAEMESWIDPAKAPGNLGAIHNLSINTAFADGHCKSIATPIANDLTPHTQYMYWASPLHPDRSNLN